MLCMESYGRIAPMAHTVFSGDPEAYRGEKAVCPSSSGLSPPEDGRISQETAGVTPWGFPNQSENE